jgi:hypothetical protein
MIFPPDAVQEAAQIRVTPDVRGMAIKFMDVTGGAVPEAADNPGEQDCILINSKVFFVKNVEDYLPFFKVMKAIKTKQIQLFDDQPPVIPSELKESFAQVAYALQLAKQIKQYPISSPLQISYWSATPYRLGEGAMKISVIPQSVEPSFALCAASDLASGLREAVATQSAHGEAVFNVCVQLWVDAKATPIEDASHEWPESLSPYRKVATLRLPPQDINAPDRLEADERQSFAPWHGLVDHQPLGGINRARRMYGDLARPRNTANCPA